MNGEYVVIEDQGEILVMDRESADQYQYPNLIVHTGHTCTREGGYTETEARALAELLDATGVRGKYRR